MGTVQKTLAFFDHSIESSCKYCSNSIWREDEIICKLGRTLDLKGCRKFRYDPLKRQPHTLPPIKEFDPKDFEI